MATQDQVSREALDAGRVDFSDIDSGERLPPIHPGEVLRRDFLEPLGPSAHALASRCTCRPIASPPSSPASAR